MKLKGWKKKWQTIRRNKKKLLAEEITKRVHSEEDFQNVLRVTDLLFSKDANADSLRSMNAKALKTVAEEIPSFRISRTLLQNGTNIMDLMAEHSQIVASKSEARRAIQGNAVSINKEKITSHEAIINHEFLLQGKYLMVENGKKNKFMVIAD